MGTFYIKAKRSDKGTIQIRDGKEFNLTRGDIIDVTVTALGRPSKKQTFSNVPVAAVIDKDDRASIGDPGGKLSVKKGGGIHSFSGSAIHSIKIKRKAMKENKLNDIVKACISKEPSKLKDLVNDVMKSKIHDVISDKRQEVAQELLTKADTGSEE